MLEHLVEEIGLVCPEGRFEDLKSLVVKAAPELGRLSAEKWEHHTEIHEGTAECSVLVIDNGMQVDATYLLIALAQGAIVMSVIAGTLYAHRLGSRDIPAAYPASDFGSNPQFEDLKFRIA